MKRRKKNITISWLPEDDWIKHGNEQMSTNFKSFRTLKIANRYVGKLMRDGKETIKVDRRTSTGWKTEVLWWKD